MFISQWNAPIRVFIDCARLILRTSLAHSINQRGDLEQTGGLGNGTVHSLHDFLHMAVLITGSCLIQPAMVLQKAQHGRMLLLGGMFKTGGRRVQQVQLLSESHMFITKISSRGRQIMRSHGRQCTLTVLCRICKPSILLLKPLNDGAQNATFSQSLRSVTGDDTQILPDDHPAGTSRFNGPDRQHGILIIGHVGSLARRQPVRNPPKSEQAQGMIDADGPAMSEHGMDQLPIGQKPGSLQAHRVKRRLHPILPLLIEIIWRGAHRGTGCIRFRMGPDIGSKRIDTNSHVFHQTNSHASIPGSPLRPFQLLISNPLHPDIEIEVVMMLLQQVTDGDRIRAESMKP